ncbi:MAG: VWA domain-containing protein [SAR324 cluster bacterium]|nr:VWA domain-containing protein [SAR324 cluster bacterium]
MARRLPVYLLLDVSGSMHGEPIEAVKNGLQMLISALRSDPQALEMAYLSVITFESVATQLIPLTDLLTFQPPLLNAGGGTSMGDALRLVKKCADMEVQKSTAESKGDWKPLVFLLTDGSPTDDWNEGLTEFKKRKWGIVVACAAGTGADTTILHRITENVVVLDTADQSTIKAFFKWVSSTVSVSSKSVGSSGKEVISLDQLQPLPAGITIPEPPPLMPVNPALP